MGERGGERSPLSRLASPRSFLAAATRLQIFFPASVGSACAFGTRSIHGCILVAATRLFPSRNRSGLQSSSINCPETTYPDGEQSVGMKLLTPNS